MPIANLFDRYRRRYEEADLSDEFADELMASCFGIKRELLDVQEEFLPQFRKISAEIDAQLALAVPLVDPS